MISKKIEWQIFFRISILFATLVLCAVMVARGRYSYSLIMAVIIIYQLIKLYHSQVTTRRQLIQFFDELKYGDFTGTFLPANTSAETAILKDGFEFIKTTFRKLSREKETQYQYLQNILELVNTGVLCFDTVDGTVIWMNESVKKMLGLPYLKTIHSLKKRDDLLYQQMLNLKPGQSRISMINHSSNTVKILLSATSFSTDGRQYTLLGLQNIHEAMEETESRAWQKLLSVLTHEIMNSIAPISSLADTLSARIKDIEQNATASIYDDLNTGLFTIRKRSEGLLKFATTYRNLNKIIRPDLKKLYASDLFEHVHTLMQPALHEKKIKFDIILPEPELYFHADINLIEQVLINLVLNAIDAVKNIDNPHIAIMAIKENNGKTTIRISDNGGGIANDLMDKIFIPFFSTKKNGSGIGLTLCKQIMLLHQGSIEARNITKGYSDFVLTF